MEIIIDVRERSVLEKMTEFCELNIKSESLNLGDIMIKYNGVPKVLIERKTLTDLIASIKDGRYIEQSLRLQNNGLCHNHHIIYLIEGNIYSLQYSAQQMVYSSIFSLNLMKGYSIMRTQSVEETCQYIYSLTNKMQKVFINNSDLFYNLDISNNAVSSEKDYCNVVKTVKKENVTVENIGEIMLMQIPGISAILAKAILCKFSSFPDFMQKINEDASCLDGLSYESKGKTRKISKSCIESIKKFLISDIV